MTSRHLSLRVRVLAAATAGVTVVLVAGGLLLGRVLEESLVRSAVEGSRLRARDLAALAAEGALPVPVPITSDDEALVQVVDGAGRVVSASANVTGEPDLRLPRARVGEETVVSVAQLPVGEHGRFEVVVLGVAAPRGPVTIYVAVSRAEIRETVLQAGAVALAGLPPIVAVLALLVWILVGRTLRPVEQIRRDVEALSVRHPEGRVSEPPRLDEIGRLARTMNAMLARLEDATSRQRRFVADAAHELRSPIASLRAQLETARASRRPDWEAISADLLADTVRMGRLSEQLLTLARADAGALRIRSETVDLDDVVERVASGVAGQAGDRGVDLDVRGVRPAQVHGDATLLELVVRNLVDNAVRHARTRVAVASGMEGATAVLTVDDDGPGVPPDRRDEVFVRFVRLDSARDRDAGGAGLGLAIARDIALAHAGDLRLEASPEGGARAVLSLPHRRPPPPSSADPTAAPVREWPA